MELCGVETVLSGAVSGSLCGLDRVSGGGDPDVIGVDTVVSAVVSECQWDLDSVSRGDIVVSFDDTSLAGGRNAIVSGVDESVCGTNSVLAAGFLDLRGVDQCIMVLTSLCVVSAM